MHFNSCFYASEHIIPIADGFHNKSGINDVKYIQIRFMAIQHTDEHVDEPKVDPLHRYRFSLVGSLVTYKALKDSLQMHLCKGTIK